MNLHLHFIAINSDFNQAIADDLYEGQESEDNIKQLWEDEFKVSEPIQAYKIKNNTTYTLAGFFADNQPFSFEIENMTIVDCTTESGDSMQFAVSKKLLKKTEKVIDEATGETHLYFYLRDLIAIENPMNGVYIVKSDFPNNLKNGTPS